MFRCRTLLVLALSFVVLMAVVVAPVVATTPAQSGGEVHVVVSGETLWSIAQQYGVTLADLQSVNGIADTSQIQIGQRLTIPDDASATPAPGVPTVAPSLPRATPVVRPVAAEVPASGATRLFGQTHVVIAGESLGRIAARYGTSISALATANGIVDVDSLYAGQRLLVPGKSESAGQPGGFEAGTLPDPFVSVNLRDPNPGQGDTVLVMVETNQEVTLSGKFDSQPVRFLDQGLHHWGLAAVHAMADVGPHDLAITASGTHDGSGKVIGQVWVKPGKFQKENIDLPPDRQKLLDPKLVKTEAQHLAAALADTNVAPLWTRRFSFPLTDPVISSEFGTRRSYNGGPVSGYHEGFDYDAREGVPVMAAADGRVVLAEKLLVRGNALLLDHGLGVHTGYWHLSKINVKVGQMVKAGDVIALVGGTGLATGPHLHWEVRVGDINVNPKQWVEQSFP
jgi:murein DD-endopeptidase MepM/ murein hydrolase activator NlpD